MDQFLRQLRVSEDFIDRMIME